MAVQQLQEAFFLHQQGRLHEAVAGYQNVLRENSRNIDALNLLGQCFFHLGAHQEASKYLKKCLKLRPDFAPAYVNLGDVQVALGDLKGALLSLRRVVALTPESAEAHGNLGCVLFLSGNSAEAVASCQKSLALNPEIAGTHANMGSALVALGRYAEAEPCFRRALSLAPDFVAAHCDLGNALHLLGRYAEAETSFSKAIELAPAYITAYCNLGMNLQVQNRLLEAETVLRQALELDPKHVEALVRLGKNLAAQCRYAEAESYCLQALQLNPTDLNLHSNLLFNHNYMEGISPLRCLEQARQCGQILSRQAGRRFSAWNAVPAPERLRVGVVSGDLRIHPVGFFLEGFLPYLDPARIELLAYPTIGFEDDLTARIRPRFSAWKPIVGKSDKAAAELIRADGIHVLVDLSGHTEHNRLPVFAWKPAPVQVSWLGYFSTTGLAEMDYVMADAVGVPEPNQSHFIEHVWYLPDTRLCFSAPDHDIPEGTLPALANGFITFGCFQNFSKIGDGVLAAWARVLSGLPNAKLRLQAEQYADKSLTERLLERFQAFGIDSSRLVFAGKMPRADYLAAHHSVDLILDTFPYPGGTTTCDALWMGVPTLTLAGNTLLARQGASLLTAAGLPEWIAANEAEYVEKAITLASDLPKLAALRSGLRAKVLASPLFDAPRFARNLENALWGMWHARTDTIRQ